MTHKLTLKVRAGGGYKNVLVVGADALSRYVDWTDRGTCILFGDASGALLLQVWLQLFRLNCLERLGVTSEMHTETS